MDYKSKMTKEEVLAFERFIDLLAELTLKYGLPYMDEACRWYRFQAYHKFYEDPDVCIA